MTSGNPSKIGKCNCIYGQLESVTWCEKSWPASSRSDSWPTPHHVMPQTLAIKGRGRHVMWKLRPKICISKHYFQPEKIASRDGFHLLHRENKCPKSQELQLHMHCEGFIRHKPPGPHPRVRLALPSSGVDLASIRHRFPDLTLFRCRIDAKSTPEEGRARRIRGWGPGGLCLINPSQMQHI